MPHNVAILENGRKQIYWIEKKELSSIPSVIERLLTVATFRANSPQQQENTPACFHCDVYVFRLPTGGVLRILYLMIL